MKIRNLKFRLRSYGVSYSDTYMWRSNYCPQGLLNYFHRLKQFHESPFIKFVYNAASYIFFLLLFSYYLLFAFHSPTDETPSINWTEILVIIIVSTMLMEDIRQVEFYSKSIGEKYFFLLVSLSRKSINSWKIL